MTYENTVIVNGYINEVPAVSAETELSSMFDINDNIQIQLNSSEFYKGLAMKGFSYR